LKRRIINRWYILPLFIISLFLLFGCETVIQGVRPYQPFPDEILESPRTLVNELRKREGLLENLKAITHLTLNTPDKNLTTKEVFILKKNLALRVETINFFGHPTMYLVSNNKELLVYFPFEGKFLRTEATRKNLYKWTGVNLNLSQIMKILSGTVPLSIDTKQMRGIYTSREKRYILQIYNKEEDVLEEIWIEADRFIPARSLLFSPEGEVLLDVEYHHFKKVQDYLLPFSIKVSFPKENTDIKIVYKKVYINQKLSDDIFHLFIPKKATEIILNESSKLYERDRD